MAKIRRAMTMPKANRPEDTEAIMFARMATASADRAHELAQKAPNSEDHRNALAIALASENLRPRNNLRIFTTPEDVVKGLHKAHTRVAIANAEWLLADLRHGNAIGDSDEAAQAHWAAEQNAADANLWLAVERLLRIPATSLAQFRQFKTLKLRYGVGNLEWLRMHKPELAVIMDDELARLDAEKAARSTKQKGSR